VIEGEALVGVGASVMRLTAGDVVLFQPGQDHVLLDASPDLDLWVVALRPELASRVCDSLNRTASGRVHLPPRAKAELDDVVSRLSTVRDAAAVEARLGGLFERIRAQLSVNHVLSRRALQQVEDDPGTSGAVLAQRLGVDHGALSRQFHKDLAVPFVSFRARHRAMAFVRHVDSGLSLSRAAMAAGFGSYAQCHRVTTQVLGCSPQRYFAGERRRIDAALESASELPVYPAKS